MADVASLNPIGKINVIGSLGTMGSILLVFFIAFFILGGIGFLIYMQTVKKQYWLRIHVFRLIGNIPTRVAIYCAKEVPFGMAGDKLWRVAPMKAFTKPFKIIKWLPVGRVQTAPSEFWYYIREDGEWINFIMDDLNVVSRQMGVKFVKEDMRLQRLATERLLEQRLMNKTFWDKWGNTIMTLVFFIVIATCMVIIFYQWGKLLDQMTPAMADLSKGLQIVMRNCPNSYTNSTGGTLIPAS